MQLDGEWRAALKKASTAKGVGKDDAEVVANIDAVRAVGLSAWVDGTTSHGLFRVSMR